MNDYHQNPAYNNLPPSIYNSVHTTAIVSIGISMVAATYIMWNIWYLHKNHPSQMNFYRYILAVMSFCDFTFGLEHGIDHIVCVPHGTRLTLAQISLALGRVISGWPCLLKGFLMSWTITYQAVWVFIMGFSVFQRVVQDKDSVFATSWKLSCGVGFGIPFVYTLIPFFWGGYGNTGMWCGLPSGRDLWIFNQSIITISVIANSFFYVSSATAIRRTVETSKGALQTEAVSRMEKSAKRLPVFVLIYLVQWIPWCFFVIFHLFKIEVPLWQIYFTVTTVNSGGIMNAVAFHKLILKNVKAEIGRSTKSGGGSKPAMSSHA